LAIANGYSFAAAANFTAMFFGSILVCRLLAAALGHRVKPAFLVIGGIGCIVVMLTIASVTHGAPIALALVGFATAPIFSATLVWLGAALPISAHANALVIGGAVLGAAFFPPLVGRVIGAFGEFVYVEQDGMQLGGGPGQAPAGQHPGALVEPGIHNRQFAGQ
jgi:fucose permease